MVEGQLILAGVVIAVIVRVILEEALKVLLVEGHALARDNIVVDVVGLLGNSDRTGGSNTLAVNADNIEGHGFAAVELGSGNGNGLVLLDGILKAVDLSAVEVALVGGLAVAVIQVGVIIVGEGDFLVRGSTGNGVLDGVITFNGDSEGDGVGHVVLGISGADNKAGLLLAEITGLRSDGNAIGEVLRGLAAAIPGKLKIRGSRTDKRHRADVACADGGDTIVTLVSRIDDICKDILEIVLAVRGIIAIVDGAQGLIEIGDGNGVFVSRILNAVERNRSSKLSGTALEAANSLAANADDITAAGDSQLVKSNTGGINSAAGVGVLNVRRGNRLALFVRGKDKAGVTIRRHCLIVILDNLELDSTSFYNATIGKCASEGVLITTAGRGLRRSPSGGLAGVLRKAAITSPLASCRIVTSIACS